MNPLKEIFYGYLRNKFKGCDSVLELGCGYSSYLEHMRVPYAVGVDGWAPAVEKSKEKGTHQKYIVSDIMDVEFPEKSFDAVLSCETLEHLTETDAEIMLKRMERWARKKVIITVPNEPRGLEKIDKSLLSSEGYDRYNNLGLMDHNSAWTVRELENRGFTVKGFKGFYQLRSTHHRERGRFTKMLWYATFPLTWLFFPSLGTQLIAVKEITKTQPKSGTPAETPHA